MTELFEFSGRPELLNPALIIGWDSDVSSLGAKAIDYLSEKLGGQPFCEIELEEFFSLGE